MNKTTVAELISDLSKYPQDSLVGIEVRGGGEAPLFMPPKPEFKTVEYYENQKIVKEAAVCLYQDYY